MPSINRRSYYSFLITAVLFGFILASGWCQTAQTNTTSGIIRIGLAADPQGADKNSSGSRHYRDSLRKMKDFTDAMLTWNPDFVIELGDMVDLYSQDYLNTLDAEYSRFPAARRHYVLGNHDSPRKSFCSTVSGFKAPYYSFELKGVTFIILDGNWDITGKSHTPPWDKSFLPQTQLNWLETTLNNIPGKAVVFIHQRLDGDPKTNPHLLRNAPDVRNVLERSQKVIAVFQGHDHHAETKNVVNSITYYTVWAMVEDAYPGTSYAYILVDAATGTVSLYGCGSQCSYAVEKPPADIPVNSKTIR
jgi:alkaline phosphatase